MYFERGLRSRGVCELTMYFERGLRSRGVCELTMYFERGLRSRGVCELTMYFERGLRSRGVCELTMYFERGLRSRGVCERCEKWANKVSMDFGEEGRWWVAVWFFFRSQLGRRMELVRPRGVDSSGGSGTNQFLTHRLSLQTQLSFCLEVQVQN